MALSALTISFVCVTKAGAQTMNLSGRVDLLRHSAESSRLGSSEVVVWLTPLGPGVSSGPAIERTPLTLSQKNKQFSPHLLVIPVGSSVDFPNLDPFFHNVFSLFNGKRFDLGLYEGHTHRSVQFDREGVSFIFCNIHPDMGAVVVALSTPYFAISNVDGSLTIRNVPRGRYRLSVWAENALVAQLNELSRIVEVDPQHTDLGTLHLDANGELMKHHPNKFGEPYKPSPRSPY